MEISKDERERAIMRSRRMFQTDQSSNIQTAERRGGVKKLQYIVNHMHQEGFDVKTIAIATDISEQEVKDILDSKESEQ
jgi:predicted transposase/invertase (TIGR01784 family)